MRARFAVSLAWRNVWRQKRRTFITAGSVATAMLLSLFMRSMQEGSYANNLDNATRFYSGYLQLQHPEFSESGSIDKLLPSDDAFLRRVQSIDGLTTAVPRLESFGLGAAGSKSKGVIVMGVAPEAEDAYSGLAARVRHGRYFAQGDENAALVGGRLAKYLEIEPGDELVLYGQGYHGATAAGLFQVAGIIDYPNQALDSRIVYLPLAAAQRLYATGERVSAWVLHGENVRGIPALEAAARATMDGIGPTNAGSPTDIESPLETAGTTNTRIRVRNWAEISPELEQQITLDRVSGQFLVLILYGIVGFGVFATIAMMTLERRREFGVMLATGMPRLRLIQLVLFESVCLAATGIALGLVITMPVLLWFYRHPIPLSGEIAAATEAMGFEPIIPFSLAPEIFLEQVQILVVIFAACSTYPMFRIWRLKAAAALKG